MASGHRPMGMMNVDGAESESRRQLLKKEFLVSIKILIKQFIKPKVAPGSEVLPLFTPLTTISYHLQYLVVTLKMCNY